VIYITFGISAAIGRLSELKDLIRAFGGVKDSGSSENCGFFSRLEQKQTCTFFGMTPWVKGFFGSPGWSEVDSWKSFLGIAE